MKSIMIIEDDIYIGNVLEETLETDYVILRAYSGTEAIYALQQTTPDLILLDLMLPGLNGEEVLAKVKDIPVIVVSAKIDIDHKVELLLNGAVDYMTKPFDMKELCARIAVQLRKQERSSSSFLMIYDGITLHTDTHIVLVEDQEVKLTRTEYAILKVLMQHPSTVTTKSFLLDHISRDTPDCTESSLKMHISNLRKKLREVNQKDYIEAVWGIGFKLRTA